jgi:hypothetical protein
MASVRSAQQGDVAIEPKSKRDEACLVIVAELLLQKANY